MTKLENGDNLAHADFVNDTTVDTAFFSEHILKV